MAESSSQDLAALLADAKWVRALARHLASDAHTAEDLAQDALAAALVRSPPRDLSLRSWLAGTLRNLARQERRGAANRSARERSAARGETDPSSEQLLERLETHRFVVDAVARLEPPYRDAILMRYFEGLSPAAIAARTGAPLRTVHTRLTRALARLRTELDRAHGGDGRAWLLALIPLARGSEGWSAAAIGALVMDAKVKIAIAVIAVAGVCSTIAFWPSDAAAPQALAAGPSVSEVRALETPSSEPRVDEVPIEVERRAQESSAAIEAAPPAVAPGARAKLAGRVIDVERAPVAGVKVRFFDSAAASPVAPAQGFEATTDASGAFELDDPQRGGHLDVASPGWTSIFRPEFGSAPEAREIVIVVARGVVLSGIVVDEQGRAIESASVAVTFPWGLRSRFDAILDSSSTVDRKTETGADGRFELRDVPLVDGAKLDASHAAYLIEQIDVPAHDELALQLVLHPAKRAPERLIGTVVDPAGEPVAGAWVALGSNSAKSGPSGEFVLELATSDDDRAPSAVPLRAVKPGYLPAELALPIGNAWPEPLVLQLGGAPLAIRGRVLDSAGEPVANAQVWSDEETHFGYVEIEGGEMSMRAGANIEGVLRGDPWTRRVASDADGRFEITGLLPRSYRIHALDTARLLETNTRIEAGARDVEIRMPREEVHRRIAGRVVTLSGEPIEGLEVLLERPSAGTQGGDFDRIESAPAPTDAEGRFEFENVSRSVSVVRVRGVELGLQGFERALAPDEDLEELELAVPLRVHVQIDGGEHADFDQVALLDAKGEKLYLSVHHGKSAYAMQEMRLEEGRTEPFSASELATTLVLYKSKVEVRRMPLKLVRGELNTIRP